VLFTADDLDVISGSPAGRRAYLDAALSQLDRSYYAALQRYARLLQQRNASLRRLREGLAGPEELALWDDGFTREGAVIIAARNRAVSALASLAAEAHAELSGNGETLSIRYRAQLGEQWQPLLQAGAGAEAVRPLFAAALAGQRRRETAAGVSLVGPHRDDLAIDLDGVSAAAFGSRAQIRTAALALRLAEARLLLQDNGDPPLVLLDDIVSELDARRRGSVLAGLAGFDQVWLTATSAESLPASFLGDAARFSVAAGRVTPA
jgi:DNA replication and repair protein RecF